MIYLKQSTASQEIILGRFVDATDGDTEETGLTINAADIKIWKNGGTTVSSKNSGGATHIANGLYYCVLDATDTDTAGPLEIHVHVSGARTVVKECTVLAANVYDSIIAGTDYLDINMAQVLGVAPTASYQPWAQVVLTSTQTTTSLIFTRGSLSTANNSFRDMYAYGVTGVNAGVYRLITSSTDSGGATCQLSVKAFPTAPTAGDIYILCQADPLGLIATEPTGVFSWTTGTFRDILGWLGVKNSNKITQTATTMTIRDRADSTTLASCSVSDDGSTATKGSES